MLRPASTAMVEVTVRVEESKVAVSVLVVPLLAPGAAAGVQAESWIQLPPPVPRLQDASAAWMDCVRAMTTTDAKRVLKRFFTILESLEIWIEEPCLYQTSGCHSGFFAHGAKTQPSLIRGFRVVFKLAETHHHVYCPIR